MWDPRGLGRLVLVLAAAPFSVVACSSATEEDAGSSESDTGITTPDAGGDAGEESGRVSGCSADGAVCDAGTFVEGEVDAGVPVDGGVAAGSGEQTRACDSAEEGGGIDLACPDGDVIGEVVFASYGNPSGSCGDFETGTCDAAFSTSVVEALCMGRRACTVPATNGFFDDPCNGVAKRLSVEVRCRSADAVVDEGAPFKGVANSPCAARRALNVSWYYNWMQYENEPCTDGSGGAFVPMIWGHTGDERMADGISSAVASFRDNGDAYVLGFNEPDNSSQANIPLEEAVALWPSFDHAGIRVGSPATTSNADGQAWFSEFMSQVDASAELRADFLAIHWYGWNAGSCDANASQLESYIEWAEGLAGGRPIWITELGCLHESAPDVETVEQFYEGALAVFARHPRVERYAWYPWAANCHLVDEDGSLTSLGLAYAAAPARR